MLRSLRRGAGAVTLVVVGTAGMLAGLAPPAYAATLTALGWSVSSTVAGAAGVNYTYTFTTATIGAVGQVTMTVPAGTDGTPAVGTVTPSSLKNLPGASVAWASPTLPHGSLIFTSAATPLINASTPVSIQITGLTNTATPGSYTSLVSTKISGGIALIDSGTTPAVTITGTLAGPPTAVSATPGDTTATISWTAPTSLGTGTLTGYTATATVASNTFTCTTTSAVTCVITGLTDGTTYSVTVVTLTTVGSSPPSSPAVNVEPVGILALTSPTSLTWAATGTGLNQSTVDGNSGDQQLTATDNTGTGAGWHITVSATTFTTGPKSLPDNGAVDFTGSVSSSLASTAPTATCVGSCTLPTDTTTYPVVMTTAVSSPTAYTVYDTSVSTGEGVMTIGGSSATNPIGWWVQVPASAYAGSYTSTVTLQVVSGP